MLVVVSVMGGFGRGPVVLEILVSKVCSCLCLEDNEGCLFTLT